MVAEASPSDGSSARSCYRFKAKRLIVTAGHCVRQRSNIFSRRASASNASHLSGDNAAATEMSVPFTFSWEAMRPWHILRDGMDYGVLFVDSFSKINMVASGKIALDEKAWDGPLPPLNTPFTSYWLVGSASVDNTEERFGRFQTYLFRIDRLAERPDDFLDEPKVETLWGRILGVTRSPERAAALVYAVLVTNPAYIS